MPPNPIRQTYDEGHGVLRLIPIFVPRRFGLPGKRLRLHPDDYFALGTARGAIKERWFSSFIAATNGPLAPADEGLSYVLPSGDNLEEKFTLKHAGDELQSALLGDAYWNEYRSFPVYAKFFDYQHPLFHHLHLTAEAAARVGRLPKPECYYFPPQLNNHPGSFPATYFGFSPEVTIDQVRDRLLQYLNGDNRITELSRAFRIELGTGWYTPPGVVHAPGSFLTYEPQWNSDVNSVYENIATGEVYPYEFLVENCPEDKKHDIDYILSLMDWPKNVDPDYRRHYFRPPIVSPRSDASFTEKWIAYGNPYFSAKEFTVQPGQSVTLSEPLPYGCILIQGHGTFGVHQAESACMLRYGQASADEFFVGIEAARRGVTVANHSRCEPMVILAHFGPTHPGMPGEPS